MHFELDLKFGRVHSKDQDDGASSQYASNERVEREAVRTAFRLLFNVSFAENDLAEGVNTWPQATSGLVSKPTLHAVRVFDAITPCV